ncbi:MAG TPA: hypothetical protein VGD14_15205 [bacterium]
MDTCQPAGHFQTTWDGADEHNLPVAASVYFCSMETNDPSIGSPNKSGPNFVRVIKLALVK